MIIRKKYYREWNQNVRTKRFKIIEYKQQY